VQIYEPVLVDWQDRVTTGLLYGVRYVKDNRLLPRGFDKHSVSADIAVTGAALDDDNFIAGGDRIRFRLDIAASEGATIDVELLYQSIGYRWAENLIDYPAAETDRFLRMYRETANVSAARLAFDSIVLD
jgi:hypothetical protein